MTRIFKWIIALCVLGSIAAVAIGAHLTLKYLRMNRDVLIQQSLPNNIEQSTPFEFTTRIENKGTAPLKDAEIAFTLPKEILNTEAVKQNELHSVTIRLGDIIRDSFAIVSTTLMALSAPPDALLITATLKYLNESGTRYETEHDIPITVKEKEVIRVTVTTPKEIISGSLMDIDVTYENTGDTDYPKVSLEIDYPSEFRYVTANLPPENKRNIWDLGEVQGNGKGTIRIRGVFEGSNANTFEISATANLIIAGKAFPLSSSASKSSTTKTPIEIEIETSNNTGNAVRSGDRVSYLIRLKNLSGIPLQNTVARISLSGAFDPASLETSGRPNSASTSVAYDGALDSALLSWSPGSITEIRVSVKTKTAPELLEAPERNKKVRLTAEVTSETVPEYIKANQTRSLAIRDLTVTDGVTINALALRKDTRINFVNTGPFPLQVGKKSDFTVHWIIRNYGQAVIGATITGILGEGVEWKDSIKAPDGSGPRYDAAAKKVIWNVNRINASDASGQLEAVFQITATPEIKNIGNYLLLLQKTVLEGAEEGTATTIRSEDAILTTQLTDDPSVSKNDGKVLP